MGKTNRQGNLIFLNQQKSGSTESMDSSSKSILMSLEISGLSNSLISSFQQTLKLLEDENMEAFNELLPLVLAAADEISGTLTHLVDLVVQDPALSNPNPPEQLVDMS